MNEKNLFFYEHIGHMQISTLTLRTFEVIQSLTEQSTDGFINWTDSVDELEYYGFSPRQSIGELERFCYGFECIDHFNEENQRRLCFTDIGRMFLNDLTSESSNQASKLAILLRPAKRRNYWNVIIQESTFFNSNLYSLISEFHFRPGGARDFLRSLSREDLLQFMSRALSLLSEPVTEQEHPTLGSCIDAVQNEGKYWVSVGGKYSWFVFPQRFELPFSKEDWNAYDACMKKLIRPPEWGGGGIDIPYGELVPFCDGEKRLLLFRKYGIIRPIWDYKVLERSSFRLTAPGYLMHERKNKGFIYEFFIKKFYDDQFELFLCDASDMSSEITYSFNRCGNTYPNLKISGNTKHIVETIGEIISSEKTLTLEGFK